jgi:hypothetical protein
MIQGGEIVMHCVRRGYTALIEDSGNTVADFSAAVFYRPMTPLILPTKLAAMLAAFHTNVFVSSDILLTSGQQIQSETDKPQILMYDRSTGLPAMLLSLETTPAVFFSTQEDSFAQTYIANYTWAGASLPSGSCSVIPSVDLPDYLRTTMSYNKLGISESNSVLWIVSQA